MDGLRLTEETALPYGAVARGGSYLDWLLMACARTGAMERLLAERGITPPVFHSLYQREACFFVSLETPEELARKSVLHQLSGELMKEQLKGKRAPGELARAMDESLSWSYPFMKAVPAPRKFSVSELKEAAAPEPESAYLYGTEKEEPKRPKFWRETAFLRERSGGPPIISFWSFSPSTQSGGRGSRGKGAGAAGPSSRWRERAASHRGGRTASALAPWTAHGGCPAGGNP